MQSDTFTKYRKIWMALAMFWIVFFHSGLTFSNRIIMNLHETGYGGVDIFLFASGLGCFISLSNNGDIEKFITRRIVKLMPTYLCFIFFWGLYKFLCSSISINALIGNFFCIQYFTCNEDSFNWYISAIWLLYLLAPYFRILANKAESWISCILIILALIAFSTAFWDSNTFIIVVTRFPIFFLGMYFAKKCIKAKALNKGEIIFSLLASITGIGILLYFFDSYHDSLWSYGLYWYPFILIVPGICISISAFAKVLDQTHYGKKILKLLAIVGDHTFEIYLVHMLIFDIYDNYFIDREILPDTRKLWLFAIMLIVPCCSLLHIFSKYIVKIAKQS